MVNSAHIRDSSSTRTLLTFDVSNDDHDEEAMVVGVVGVVDAGGDLAGAHHLLQGDQHQLDGQERHTLIEEVQRAEEDQVPDGTDQRRQSGNGKVWKSI